MNQARAKDCIRLLSSEHDFYLSDFTLHSIGVLLLKHKRHDAFMQFVQDIIVNAGFLVVSVPPAEITSVIYAAERYNLDFDDAYQYVVTIKVRAELVSFDKHFDKTNLKRKEPAEII